MSEGNSMSPIPEGNTNTDRPIMSSVGSIDGFGPVVTTSDVTAGMGNLKMVALQGSDGNQIFCEHHGVNVLPVTPAPVQDVPPGESAAKP